MDIVDAQIHIGPGGIDRCLGAMDALGIASVLIDEYWISSSRGDPSYALPNGAFRTLQPTAQLAALTHLDRFSYLVRVDRRDPDLQSVIRSVRDAPHARALRISPGMGGEEAKAFSDGGYRELCTAACEAGLPVFVFAPGLTEALRRCAREFPSLRLIIDHCGIKNNALRRAIGEPEAPQASEAQLAAFEQVLSLSAFPNVALKWGHAPAMFGEAGYPGEGLWPILRRALSAFGADRVMWASDASANQTGETWAELLFGMLGNPDLSTAEGEAFLGGAVRAWLDWPKANS